MTAAARAACCRAAEVAQVVGKAIVGRPGAREAATV